MICQYCRKRIDFKNRKDTKFSSESKRWVHKSCWEKVRQQEVQAQVKAREDARQMTLSIWEGSD